MLRKLFTIVTIFASVTIFAEEVQWPPPPSGFASPGHNIPRGTLSEVVRYPTRQYNDQPFRIHLPPDYSDTREQKYPVLYLLHGIGGNENAWTSNAGHAEGNADLVMEYLYAQSDLNVVPMLVVMPMGSPVGSGMENFQGFANFEDVLINDLIPYIEENYNASSDPNIRAIAGLSMGAGQTLNFGYKNPEVFTWIGAFSPAPNTTPAGTTIRDIEAVKSNVHLNFLAAGTAEGSYLNTARTYHDYLQENGVDNLYLQVEQGLDHERENWNRQLHNFAQRIFKGVTHVAQREPLKINSAKKQKAIMVRNSIGTMSGYRGIQIIRGETGFSATKVFLLNGRALVSDRPESGILPSITREHIR